MPLVDEPRQLRVGHRGQRAFDKRRTLELQRRNAGRTRGDDVDRVWERREEGFNPLGDVPAQCARQLVQTVQKYQSAAFAQKRVDEARWDRERTRPVVGKLRWV